MSVKISSKLINMDFLFLPFIYNSPYPFLEMTTDAASSPLSKMNSSKPIKRRRGDRQRSGLVLILEMLVFFLYRFVSHTGILYEIRTLLADLQDLADRLEA
jgi:hypothetical protein